MDKIVGDPATIKCEYCKRIDITVKDDRYNGCTVFQSHQGRIVGFHTICHQVFTSMESLKTLAKNS